MENSFNKMRMEIIQTTHTPGWAYIYQLAKQVIAQSAERAISEEDEVSGEKLRRIAKAQRDFLANWEAYINAYISADDEPDTEEYFND